VTARIHPANETEAAGAKPLLAALAGRLPRLALIWVDGGDRRRFAEWASAEWGWRVEVAQHADAGRPHVWLPADASPPPAPPAGCRALPCRWMVERTVARLGRNRQFRKDYEARPSSEEAWLDAASCRLLLRRLAS
jgi:hypothetical protein